MLKKQKVKKTEQDKEILLSFKDVSVLSTRVVGKDNGNALVYGTVSYPHISAVCKGADWFNEYFEKLMQNCCEYVQGELTKNAAVEYEKSQNPRKRFCPRIYNYALECMIENGNTENILCITFTAKLCRVEGNMLLEESMRKILMDLSEMQIVKK